MRFQLLLLGLTVPQVAQAQDPNQELMDCLWSVGSQSLCTQVLSALQKWLESEPSEVPAEEREQLLDALARAALEGAAPTLKAGLCKIALTKYWHDRLPTDEELGTAVLMANIRAALGDEVGDTITFLRGAGCVVNWWDQVMEADRRARIARQQRQWEQQQRARRWAADQAAITSVLNQHHGALDAGKDPSAAWLASSQEAARSYGDVWSRDRAGFPKGAVTFRCGRARPQRGETAATVSCEFDGAYATRSGRRRIRKGVESVMVVRSDSGWAIARAERTVREQVDDPPRWGNAYARIGVGAAPWLDTDAAFASSLEALDAWRARTMVETGIRLGGFRTRLPLALEVGLDSRQAGYWPGVTPLTADLGAQVALSADFGDPSRGRLTPRVWGRRSLVGVGAPPPWSAGVDLAVTRTTRRNSGGYALRLYADDPLAQAPLDLGVALLLEAAWH